MHACACVFDELSVSDGPLLVAMQGKTFGLTFWENYYIVGQGPDFQFVRYIGHTLQGGYNGLLTCTPACAKHACERRQKHTCAHACGLGHTCAHACVRCASRQAAGCVLFFVATTAGAESTV